MSSVQRTVSAIVVLAAVLGSTTMPAFAGLTHPVCASRHHDCGATPMVSKCCCGDEQSSPPEGTPAQSRLETSSPLSSMPAVPNAVQVALTPRAVHPAFSAPPHLSAVDLPTLFSSLLI